jgi:hypothetical protein
MGNEQTWIEIRVIARIFRQFRSLGPYLAIELFLHGGSIVALLLWTYRNRVAARKTAVRMYAKTLPARCRVASQRGGSALAAPTRTAALHRPVNVDFETTRDLVAVRGAAASKVGGFAPVGGHGNAPSKVGRFAPVGGHGNAILWQGARYEDQEEFHPVPAPVRQLASAGCGH